jgi:1-acyl-sn-glycerol-3-phosphate acyltransferase
MAKISLVNHKIGLFQGIGNLLFEKFCRTVFRIYTPVKVFGKEHLLNSSYILCSNHNSHMDSAVLMYATDKNFEDFALLAAFDYWYKKSFPKLMGNFLNLIPIDRNQRNDAFPISDTLRLCKLLVQKNKNLVIFPEGTRSNTGRIKQPFKRGAAVFSILLDIQIIPVYINGTFSAWPKGQMWIAPKQIDVFFGEPIDKNEYFSKDSYQTSNLSSDIKRLYVDEKVKFLTKVLEERINVLETKALGL